VTISSLLASGFLYFIAAFPFCLNLNERPVPTVQAGDLNGHSFFSGNRRSEVSRKLYRIFCVPIMHWGHLGSRMKRASIVSWKRPVDVPSRLRHRVRCLPNVAPVSAANRFHTHRCLFGRLYAIRMLKYKFCHRRSAERRFTRTLTSCIRRRTVPAISDRAQRRPLFFRHYIAAANRRVQRLAGLNRQNRMPAY
jgi:hypothetical protein